MRDLEKTDDLNGCGDQKKGREEKPPPLEALSENELRVLPMLIEFRVPGTELYVSAYGLDAIQATVRERLGSR